MAQSEWRGEWALFSDSFRSTVAGLVEELGGTVSAAKPGDDRRAAGAHVILRSDTAIDDPPTKPIDLARLQENIAASTPPFCPATRCSAC